MYKLLNYSDCILRISDGANIPPDNRNNDYKEYLEWIAKGNKPLPADPLPNNNEEIQKQLDQKQADEYYYNNESIIKQLIEEKKQSSEDNAILKQIIEEEKLKSEEDKNIIKQLIEEKKKQLLNEYNNIGQFEEPIQKELVYKNVVIAILENMKGNPEPIMRILEEYQSQNNSDPAMKAFSQD